ncbi:MAG: EutN/CcmL family microcompartment protein [Phycisphaerales bacterium]|jgi:ethanolamine utilization protein EutN|nr:EutN/CcmL family microcompartment protein [Phycisphaerales bacterium]
MQLGKVIGHATATLKHPSMVGWRLVIVQLLGVEKQPEGDPVIAVDKLGSATGQVVVLNCDGKAARELVGDDKSPVRWFVIAIVDEIGK